MTKTEMAAALPSGPQRAMQQMERLEEQLTTLDQHLAVALNRIEEQQDSMAESLTPMLHLRDQVVRALKEAEVQLQASTNAAKHSAAMAADAESVAQEAAQLLAYLATQARPSLWKYCLVAVLSGALLLASLSLWPSLAIQATIQLDPRQNAAAIAQELARIALEQRRMGVAR